MNSDELEIRQLLKDNLEHYAAKCLKIRAKAGDIQPLTFNRAQQYLHTKLEEQKDKIGKVRALILKGRQQGCSTYVGGRFYHKVTHTKGYRVYILTHEQDATDNLFGMANRFHEWCPEAVKPHTGTSNAKELFFDNMDSGYKVGTAGTKAVGRSQTIQLFHGSEVGFWPNADTHAAGILQAVPDMYGTEVILESTANGIGNFFHQRWREAETGASEYIAIFIPWFWQDEYRREPPKDFIPTQEERDYQDAYGIDLWQVCWMRNKIVELKDPLLFKQEYPACSSEAFQLTGHDSFIPPALVMKARKAKIEGIGPLIIGADPARYGDDRFSLAWRKGREVIKTESRRKINNVQGANWIKQVIDKDKPAKVFIDVGGVGGGVVDILESWGEPYEDIIKAISFGEAPQDEYDYNISDDKIAAGPLNRRAEMWMRSKDWLETVGGVSVPDEDSIQADACSPSYKYNINNKLVLESKEEMRRKLLMSPDEWDGIALTFAEPVAEKTTKHIPLKPTGTSGLV